MGMSSTEFQILQMRLAAAAGRKKQQQLNPNECDVELESELHQQILDYCRANGWIALHGSMASRTRRTVGESDFCCILPNGRVIFVECKTKTGKLSVDQQAMKAWMEKLGHTMHVVRTLKEFVDAVSKTSPTASLSV